MGSDARIYLIAAQNCYGKNGVTADAGFRLREATVHTS
jgi:hypothetical protein